MEQNKISKRTRNLWELDIWKRGSGDLKKYICKISIISPPVIDTHTHTQNEIKGINRKSKTWSRFEKKFLMYNKGSKRYQESTLWTHQSKRNCPIHAQETKTKICVQNSTSKTLHKYLISITRKINTLWHTVTVELIQQWKLIKLSYINECINSFMNLWIKKAVLSIKK